MVKEKAMFDETIITAIKNHSHTKAYFNGKVFILARPVIWGIFDFINSTQTSF